MLLRTYNKIMAMFDEANGYLTTKELQAKKITMVQLNDLIEMGIIERVTHGVYWKIDKVNGKPANYKYIELSKANEECIICAASALYILGYIDTEPEVVSVATSRTDRARMNVNFPVSRHYFSGTNFDDETQLIETPYGSFKVYDVDRSVCDCIRLRETLDPKLFETIIEKYRNDPKKNRKKFLRYSDHMRIRNIAMSYAYPD